jgi:NAD(P)-dependent dehydrogenase (short-subunit alcohol dehydrogenase family)
LGLAIARRLAARGARLVLVSRSADHLDRAVSELALRGADVVARVCDVRDEAAVQALVTDVVAHLGPIDVLVNVAGVMESTPFVHATNEDFENSLATHFWGPLFLIRAALPSLTRRRGRIVNISSIGGRVAVPHLLPYCVGKFALSALSDGLRAELASQDVSVLTVTPGLMRTGSYRNVTVRGRHQLEAAWFALGSITPLTAVKVEKAAEQIVAATAARRARLTIGGQARLAELGSALAPELAAWMTELAAAVLLPRPGASVDSEARVSRDLDLGWFASILPTSLARHMNQPIAADERGLHPTGT